MKCHILYVGEVRGWRTERLRAICKRLFKLAVVTIVSRQPEESESPEAQRRRSLRDASASLRKESTSMSRWNDGRDRRCDAAVDDDDDDDGAAESSEGFVSLRAMQVLCRGVSVVSEKRTAAAAAAATIMMMMKSQASTCLQQLDHPQHRTARSAQLGMF